MVQWIERDLARHLGVRRPVYGLSEELTLGGVASSIETLAARHIRAMRLVQPEGPYQLVGHSFGGLVAYEMAQQLRSLGQTVAMLGLVDTYVPAAFTTRTILPFSKQISNALKTPITDLWRYTMRFARRNVIAMFPASRHLILDKSTAIQVQLARAEEMIRQYTPAPYPGRIQFFKSMVSVMELRAAAPGPPEIGWNEFALGGVDVRNVPGNHVQSVRDPLAALTAAAIESCLEG
jgi:thioesterase domain-containing protein